MTSSINSQSSDLRKSSTTGNASRLTAIRAHANIAPFTVTFFVPAATGLSTCVQGTGTRAPSSFYIYFFLNSPPLRLPLFWNWELYSCNGKAPTERDEWEVKVAGDAVAILRGGIEGVMAPELWQAPRLTQFSVRCNTGAQLVYHIRMACFVFFVIFYSIHTLCVEKKRPKCFL